MAGSLPRADAASHTPRADLNQMSVSSTSCRELSFSSSVTTGKSPPRAVTFRPPNS